MDHIPQTELLKERGMEILYFTDKADEFLPDVLRTYQDKPFRSAIDGDLELGDEESVILVNLFIKHMIDNVMNSKEPGDQKYVKTIQM